MTEGKVQVLDADVVVRRQKKSLDRNAENIAERVYLSRLDNPVILGDYAVRPAVAAGAVRVGGEGGRKSKVIVRVSQIERVGIGETMVDLEIGDFFSLSVRDIAIFLRGKRIAGRESLNARSVDVYIFEGGEIVGFIAFDRTSDRYATPKQAVRRGNRC